MIQKKSSPSKTDDTMKDIDSFNTFMVQNGAYVRSGGNLVISPGMDKMQFDALVSKYKTLQGKRSRK